jgi:hypothetical protein
VLIVGSVALTYFSDLSAVDAVTRSVGEHLGIGLEEDWTTATAYFADGSVTVNRRGFSPGSAFSRAILGTLNAARQGRELADGGLEAVCATLERCDVMLGFVFTPPLVGEGDRIRIAAMLAEELAAIVFDGQFLFSRTLFPLVELSADARHSI